MCHQGRSARGREPDIAREPGRRDLNGTAVLGLGNIGALAGKPVMEGKGCLFRKFAGIDVFDIEIDETDPDKLIDIIASRADLRRHQPGGHQGAGVLRDRDEAARAHEDPVFHDDQHGTAIVAAAAVLNGLQVVGKRIEDVKLVCSGAGAAAIACLNILVGLGVRKENILVTDSKGVVYKVAPRPWTSRRRSMPVRRRPDPRRIVEGADIFLGLSAAGVLKPEMVKTMAEAADPGTRQSRP